MNKTKNITNDLITEYINGFYKPIDQALMNLRLEAEEADVPIILRESEDFFNVFLSAIKPKRILEIGTAVGYSAAYFALQTDAYVITVEKDEIMYQKAKENIERLNLRQQIRIIQGDGEEVILALAADGEDPFDLVFIDAAKSHYQRFLDAALRLCKPGTVIISDNVLFRGRVASDTYDPTGKHKTNIKRLREYVSYIYSHPKLRTSVIACGDGLAISIVK